MDFSIKHWAPFPRRFPSPFPVISAVMMMRKAEWLRRAMPTCTFSLILRGRGEYIRFGKTWPVEAPCVITQWPDEYLEYGPFAHETWDELFIDYDASLFPKFQLCRFVDLERPVWPIADVASVNTEISELQLLTQSSTPELVVDRVDRLCERLVLETWLSPPNTDTGGRAVQALLTEVRLHLNKAVDLEHQAAKYGMSVSTFRRQWAKITELSPARYLEELRMREACRLLVETSQPVNGIAQTVGFEDEYYFSRRFRKAFQMSPREYRKAYHIRRMGLDAGVNSP